MCRADPGGFQHEPLARRTASAHPLGDGAVDPEIALIGSRCGPFPRAIELLASGAVKVKLLIARGASLAEYESAFDDAGHALKIQLAPQPSGGGPQASVGSR